MPEYGSTILLLFILFSCVYKKHVRDWWWFKLGVVSFLVHLAIQGITPLDSRVTIFHYLDNMT